MSKKYIITIKSEYEDSFKGLMILGAKEDNLFVDTLAVENLEQYTPVDVEKVYDKAYMDGYKKGLKDGKADNDKGCDGCKYDANRELTCPCSECSNNYKNQWKANDDKIEVGDEVYWSSDCFIVTRIFQPRNQAEQCDGIDVDGCVYHDVLMDDIEKTGRHFDIAKILEEMRND